MAEMGIWLPADIFRDLPAVVQASLLERLTGSTALRQPPSPAPAAPSSNDEGLPDLSPSQATELYEGCSQKTKLVFQTIASGKRRYFQIADLAKALGVEIDALTGVWSGITKRTRTVLGDRKAQLFGWDAEGLFDGEKYVDHRGWVSETTYNSLRRALNIQ